MSLFSRKKAPRRQFRKKVVHSLEDEEGDGSIQSESQEQGNGSVTKVSSKPEPSLNPQGAPKTILSFDDDLESDVTQFKVKKSNHSKRVAKMLEHEKKKEERQRKLELLLASHEDDEPSDPEDQISSITFKVKGGFIPDSSMIYAARQRREMARKLGEQNPDILPLTSSSKSTQENVTKGKSRLVREDDDDKSDDSENELGGREVFGQRKKVSRQMEVLAAMEEANSGSDEERFIEEQINKGVKGRVIADTPTKVQTTDSSSAISHSFAYGSTVGGAMEFIQPTMFDPPQQTPAQVSIPDKLVPITMETLKSRLSRQLADLRELHSSHSCRVEQMESDLITAEREVYGLEDHINMTSIEYQFYQETKGYLRDLLSCLTEKVLEIDTLERSLVSIRGDLTELRVERRRQDMRDMAEECVQTTPIDHSHQVRIVEREGRRRRRREARRERGVVSHCDGQSSDDEILEANRIKFKTEIDNVLSKREAVFSDVLEDFSDLSSVKNHIEQWKYSFPSSYQHAYISLCLPKLFSPYIRLELLAWNPLADECMQFEDYQWFQVLMFYGFQEGVGLDRDDEDVELIPSIVEKVVLPKLTVIVQGVWDPMSSSQTNRLVSLLHTLVDEYPTLSIHSKPGQELLNTVTLKLRQTVDSDVYIPLFATKQLENPASLKALFYHRQFWSCLKLLENITKWVGLVSADILQELVLDGLLSRYLLLSLQNSPVSHSSVEKVQKLVSLLPSSWYSDGSVVTRPLQGLTRYTVHLADCLERAAVGQNDIEKTKARNSAHVLTSCLVTIGAHSEAEKISKQSH